MSTLTPNFNLIKPDSTDPFGDFRSDYNDNLDIIDANLGGGGGGGGHTIVDENGSDMPAESKLQFTGNVSVTDDNVNGATVVDVLGGGGNVYGAFVNTSNLIYSGTYSLNLSYTATEDCFIWFAIPLSSGTSGKANIDGVQVSTFWNGTGAVITESNAFYLKKGQTLTATATNSSSAGYYVYGLTQGTNGIYAPVIYSDNERVIGVWRDNKPLYQKTFVINPSSAEFDVDVSALNIDRMVKREATFSRQASPTVVQQKDLEYRTESPANNAYGIIAELRNTNLRISISQYPYTEILEFRITLFYTKTTDVAGSGNWNTDGVPTHHYSTSEQVIGTWIDGKPLYEKTVQITAFPNATTANYPHGILNADTLCDYEAKVRWASGGVAKCGGGRITLTGGNIDTNSFIGVEVDKTNIIITAKIDRRALSGEVTIRYTKTTD